MSKEEVEVLSSDQEELLEMVVDQEYQTERWAST
jgi:hypothetical protein